MKPAKRWSIEATLALMLLVVILALHWWYHGYLD